MGFSGGGTNILKPHSHDGRVVQDGGELDFNNITQANSSAGQIFYSNGTALQQLAYPGVPAGETLTAATLSTAPSWAAAAGVAVEKDLAALTAAFDTTSTTPDAGSVITGLNVTLQNVAGGVSMIASPIVMHRTTAGGVNIDLTDDGVHIPSAMISYEVVAGQTGIHVSGTLGTVNDSDGSVIQARLWVGGGTGRAYGSTTQATSNICSISVA